MIDNKIKKLLTILRSRRLAAVFIILIAAFLVLSTLIPQWNWEESGGYFYLHASYPYLTKLISFLGIDHVYTTWWFLSIVLIFSFNIALNSYERIKIVIKQLGDYRPMSSQEIAGLKIHETIPVNNNGDEFKEKITHTLKRKGYRIKAYADGFVASKHTMGLLGIPLLHLSMLIILTGVLITGLTFFKGHIELSEGQLFPIGEPNFLGSSYGFLHVKPQLDFQIRLKSFHVTYWDKDHPRLYKSIVEVYKNGTPLFSKDVEMNKPLRLEGFSFYQTNYYGYSAYFGLVDKATGYETTGYVNFPYKKNTMGVLTQQFNIPILGYLSILSVDVSNPDRLSIEILESDKTLHYNNIKNGDVISLGDFELVFHNMVKWTGFYVSRDYGVPVVFTGFVLLALSILSFVFIIPKRLWLAYEDKRLFIGAKSYSRLTTENTYKQEMEEMEEIEEECES
ncbi:MAG: cytochrome c biogenesis protein ResB [Deltaproteobacteria bacterium]|nr:cytochrome c biogenesis protein ResB [Deltaproteobacteria bacterium]MCL5276279.1 cytochrome c biogenesis protein ResB [Deltaproteobacteria bacterium]